MTIRESDLIERWRLKYTDAHLMVIARAQFPVPTLPGRTADDVAGYLERNPRGTVVAA